MLKRLMGAYIASVENDVRSPMYHLVGPPGAGKSQTVEALATLFDVNLHVVNVSRINPLELEGIQMPHTDSAGDMRLHLLHSTLWKQLKPGDIVLWDEFLRGFPEVYNGLLDIMTSRHVAGFDLPPVFFVGASNSTVAYDAALEDRLLHVSVPDLRKKNGKQLSEAVTRFIEETNLHPDSTARTKMLFEEEVLPTYEMLDRILGNTSSQVSGQSPSLKYSGEQLRKARSARNLAGQVLSRQVQSTSLRQLIRDSNKRCEDTRDFRFYVYLPGSYNSSGFNDDIYTGIKELETRKDDERLTPFQRRQQALNIRLIELDRPANMGRKDNG